VSVCSAAVSWYLCETGVGGTVPYVTDSVPRRREGRRLGFGWCHRTCVCVCVFVVCVWCVLYVCVVCVCVCVCVWVCVCDVCVVCVVCVCGVCVCVCDVCVVCVCACVCVHVCGVPHCSAGSLYGMIGSGNFRRLVMSLYDTQAAETL